MQDIIQKLRRDARIATINWPQKQPIIIIITIIIIFLLTLLYFCLICFIILRQDLKITGDLEVVKLQEALNSRFSCFYPPVVEITIVCIHI